MCTYTADEDLRVETFSNPSSLIMIATSTPNSFIYICVHMYMYLLVCLYLYSFLSMLLHVQAPKDFTAALIDFINTNAQVGHTHLELLGHTHPVLVHLYTRLKNCNFFYYEDSDRIYL